MREHLRKQEIKVPMEVAHKIHERRVHKLSMQVFLDGEHDVG